MAKNAFSDWSTTASDNTDVGGISLAEGVMLPSAVNNAFREMMAQLKGAGFIGSTYFVTASTSGPAKFYFHEDTDNGTNKVTLAAPSSLAADVTVTLPSATDTLVGKATTDTLTNKTLVGPIVATSAIDLQVGQIAFPASQNASSGANTLDDYEEGTFTPTITGASTAGTGTYSTQSGHYVKVGGRVYFDVELVWSAHTGTGNLKVSGLPFTSGNRKSSCAVSYSSLTYAGSHVLAYVEASATTIAFATAQSTAAEAAISIDTAATLRISGSYSVV